MGIGLNQMTENGGQKNVNIYSALSQAPRHAVWGSLLKVSIAFMIPNFIFLSLAFIQANLSTLPSSRACHRFFPIFIKTFSLR
jgi:hypothetical protein